MSYSQNNEEEIIQSALTRLNVETGNFLDLGAHDGKWLSNTYRLSLEGWRGVCVEASPYVFPKLVATHRQNPNIKLVNAAVSTSKEGGLVEWFDSVGDGISTTSTEHKKKWEISPNVKFQPFWISTIPLRTVFAQFGTDYTVINIDVESTNLDIFMDLPWHAFTAATKVICVEHDNHIGAMALHAEQFGFKAIATNGENLILSR